MARSTGCRDGRGADGGSITRFRAVSFSRSSRRSHRKHPGFAHDALEAESCSLW